MDTPSVVRAEPTDAPMADHVSSRAFKTYRTFVADDLVEQFKRAYLTKVGEVVNNAWLLKEIAGHKDIRTTQIYCQPTAPVVPINMLDFVGNLNGQEPLRGKRWQEAGAKSCY